ncbi:MAG: cytochrome P450 [Pseudomonadota bacterium]
MLDLRDEDFLTNPGPHLARMRAEGPLAHVRLPLIGPSWLTTTDAATRALLKDAERFDRDPKTSTGKSMVQTYWWLPRRVQPLMEGLILKDGAEHRRLRGLVSQAFARSNMEALRPAIASRADALLDKIDPTAPVDLVPAFTKQLPFEVICDLMGFAAADMPYLKRALAPLSGAGSAIGIMWSLSRLGGLLRFMRRAFETARQSPRPGLLTELVHARDGTDQLSDDELLAMVMILFIAGHETTVHLLNDCLLTLIDRPEMRGSILANRDAMALFIEEAMRHWTPVMLTKFHFARQDIEFMGVPLSKGTRVGAFLLAANHDPARISDPGFRADRRPNPHLGFGHGPHVCLGMQLARIEASVALERLLLRFPDVCLQGSPPRWLRRVGLRGPESLTVHLIPPARTA